MTKQFITVVIFEGHQKEFIYDGPPTLTMDELEDNDDTNAEPVYSPLSVCYSDYVSSVIHQVCWTRRSRVKYFITHNEIDKYWVKGIQFYHYYVS